MPVSLQNNALFHRLKRNLRVLKAYIQKEELSCYRVFDWDMPEFPLCIDVYENNIHMAEYQTKHPLSDTEYAIWLNECVEVVCNVFQRSSQEVYFKKRMRQRGIAQYEKVAEKKEFLIVQENKLQFLVNLNDYVDTGLFLDHRITRKLVQQEAKAKQVLNLFAYTGSFSVYALAGGAAKVTTVDLSNTYLDWAIKNVALNHLDASLHETRKTDVKEWIKQVEPEKYDLVICDPPTVSRSKMAKSKFDIQPDHPELIHHVLATMKPGGVLYFSNNFRDFTFHTKRIKASLIEDITLQTIPQDFRNKKIHHCWRIVK
jgi:23S rRNA (cytosine1962-C5)-methyltransferase